MKPGQPLPLSLLLAAAIPSIVVLVDWIARTLRIPWPPLTGWLMMTASLGVLLFGMARLESARSSEPSPGIRQVLEDLRNAEAVARQTQDAVNQLARDMDRAERSVDGAASSDSEEE